MDVSNAGRLPAVGALSDNEMGAPSVMPRWAWIVGAVVAVLAVLAALASVEMEASAGTQQCNTECQSKMTDCILACDGMRSCEEACKKKGQSCVGVCSSDAGPPPPPDVIVAAEDAALDRAAVDRRVVTSKDASPRAAAGDR